MLSYISNSKYLHTSAYILFVFFLCTLSLRAQVAGPAQKIDNNVWGYTVGQPLEQVTATTTADTASFNQGLLSDPAELLQGQLSGVQIYNRGGNPNALPLFRIRGLSSYAQRQPLLVVDGIAGASWYSLDPEDIASVTVLKDGAAQALYGIRASNGVILVQTKTSAFQQDTLMVSYTGQAALSKPYAGFPVMDATAFRQAGHWDFGGSTDWLNEVQRDGYSQAHNLAISGLQSGTQFRVSGNFRNIEGALRHSGYEQSNLRAHLNRSFLKDALDVKVNTAYTNRNSQLGFPEAFRYAVAYNPTIPLDAADAPFPYSTGLFGGYFETPGLFDSFNPKAIVEQNARDGLTEVLQASALASYRISGRFSIQARYAYQDQFNNQRAFYSPQSQFRGSAYSPLEERRGRADLTDESATLSLYEAFVHYRQQTDKLELRATAGTSYTHTARTYDHLQLFGFTNSGLLTNKEISHYGDWAEGTYRSDTISSGWSEKVSAFFGQLHLTVKNRLHTYASLRYEGSSKLGENNNWGLFPAIGAGYELIKSPTESGLEQLLVRVSYGITGALPDEAGLSQQRIRTTAYPNGFVDTTVIHAANPDLGWEQKREFNIGLALQTGKLRAQIDWYTRTVSDWISSSFVFNTPYTNQNAFRTTGLDLNLELLVLESPGLTYTTGIQGTAYRSVYQETGSESPALLLPSGNIFGTPTLIMQEGGQAGNIAGPIFTGDIDANGAPVFEDLNGDGMINRQPGLFGQPESDLATLGNGLPTLDWGWSHRIKWRSWEVRALLRGALGHSLANMHRLRYEPRPSGGKSAYNLFQSDQVLEGLNAYIFSSYYTERADFLKLDHLQLAKTFSLKALSRSYSLRLSATARNLLLASRYSGIDPEPVLEDPGTTIFGGTLSPDQRMPLAAGIDRLDYYLPARQFVLGLQVQL
jgi:iron complex outermembrane receptor protein